MTEDAKPGRFRKKPVVLEAQPFKPGTEPLPFADQSVCLLGPNGWYVETLEGPLHISDGDWIIKGVKGEFYPCKPDVFAEIYEAEDAKTPPTRYSGKALWPVNGGPVVSGEFYRAADYDALVTRLETEQEDGAHWRQGWADEKRRAEALAAERDRLVTALDEAEAREARLCPEGATYEQHIADREQQLSVLRPGGAFAWKEKAEALAAERDRLQKENEALRKKGRA